MSEDLSGIPISMGKKGKQAGKKRKVDEEDVSDDGADDDVLRKAKNPGSVYFEELFKKVMIAIKEHAAKKASDNEGITRHVSRQEARRILINRGCKGRAELKRERGEVTMSIAFVQDDNDSEVKEFPGPRMNEVRKQTKLFIKNTYPDIWAQFDKKFWTDMEGLADDALEKAYELWSSSGAEKSDEGAGSRKVFNQDLGLDPDDKTDSDEDTKIKMDFDKPIMDRGAGGAGGVGGGFQVLGIVGLENELVYKLPDQVLTAKVVAVYPPGAPVPEGMPMATAVEQSGSQDKGRESAAVQVKKELKVENTGEQVMKELEDKAVRDAKREEKRKQTSAMPSSGLVDLTIDD
jgi:hypothetical protein